MVDANDWLEFLYFLEKEKSPMRHQCLSIQPVVNSQKLLILFDWFVDVCDEYHCRDLVLFHAHQLTLAFLERECVALSRLQLVGSACLLICSKLHEIYPFSGADIAYAADNSFTQEEIQTAECYILEKLDYKLMFATIYDFLEVFLKDIDLQDIFEDEDKRYFESYAKYFANITLLVTDNFDESLRESDLALACLWISFKVVQDERYHFKKTNPESLLTLIKQKGFEKMCLAVKEIYGIWKFYKQSATTQGVTNKFLKKRTYCVALTKVKKFEVYSLESSGI